MSPSATEFGTTRRRPGRPRVLHLITSAAVISGAERILIDMAEAADRARFDLHFATLSPDGLLSEALRAAGYPVTPLGLSRRSEAPLTLARLVRLLGHERPDLVHAHLLHASILAAVATRVLPTPLVQTRHYSDAVDRFNPRAEALLDHWAARRCDGIAAVSVAARSQLVDVEGVRPGRVRVIENGVPVDRLRALDPGQGRVILDALGVPRGPLLVCAASLVERKGHKHLFAALPAVLAEQPAAQLVLVGQGVLEPALRAQAEALGIARQVHFLGHRADGQAIMAAADIYVQPSVEEGFGLAVIEAMAMGRACVVSDVGGMRVTVEEGQSGLRAAPGDERALAAALSLALFDENLRARLGAAATARVQAHYSIDRMQRAYERWYEDVLG